MQRLLTYKMNKIASYLLLVIGYLVLISYTSEEIFPEIEERGLFPAKQPAGVEVSQGSSPDSRPPLLPESELNETPLPLSPPLPEFLYSQIAQKISNTQYEEALNELDKFIARHSLLQPYTVEAHLVRLIILAGYRAAYLHLGNAYYAGWEKVLNLPERQLKIDEYLTRLNNLSSTSLEYYRKHKQKAVRLLKAYEELKRGYSLIEKKRLQIIAYPFKKGDFTAHPFLREIKEGQWLETAKRQQTELIEVNNCVMAFWLSLMGKRSQQEINIIFSEGSYTYTLDERGLFYWLSQTLNYHTQPFRREFYMEEPELARILAEKALEAQKTFEELNKLFGPEAKFDQTIYNPSLLLGKEK